eukprot:scaffold22638_cov67-Isochrysis_galbana.AAC.1
MCPTGAYSRTRMGVADRQRGWLEMKGGEVSRNSGCDWKKAADQRERLAIERGRNRGSSISGRGRLLFGQKEESN